MYDLRAEEGCPLEFYFKYQGNLESFKVDHSCVRACGGRACGVRACVSACVRACVRACRAVPCVRACVCVVPFRACVRA